jgi:hypothetical protein
MRVFACYVVSKLQRHRWTSFGALRFRTNNVQTDSYIFIYIYRYRFGHWIPPPFSGKKYIYLGPID